MGFYENEPQFVAHVRGPEQDEFVPVAVTIDSEPEAKMEVARKNGMKADDVEVDRIEAAH